MLLLRLTENIRLKLWMCKSVKDRLSLRINNWFMLLAVHYRVMEHVGSLESTKEA